MTTLYVSKGSTTDGEKLARSAAEVGWQTRILAPKFRGAKTLDDCAYYGEIDLGHAAAAKFGWVLLEPTLDLLTTLPEEFLHRQVQFMPLGEARELTEQRFIKPADCAARLFDADVYPEGRYIRCRANLADDVPVLVSEPVVFDVEYRLFVHNRIVVTHSPYVRGGWRAQHPDGSWAAEPAETAAALEIGGRLLAMEDLSLPPAFTLDVGQLDTGEWAVVEFNPLWCSGLLGSEAGKLLPALRRVCQKSESVSPSDIKWAFRFFA